MEAKLGRIWHSAGLHPHRVETFKFSTDLELEPNIYDVGLCLAPPERAMVRSVDEKTQIHWSPLERTEIDEVRGWCRPRASWDHERGATASQANDDVVIVTGQQSPSAPG